MSKVKMSSSHDIKTVGEKTSFFLACIGFWQLMKFLASGCIRPISASNITWQASPCVSLGIFYFSYKDTSHIGLEANLMASF